MVAELYTTVLWLKNNMIDCRMTLQWCVLHYGVAGEKCYLLQSLF